MIGILGGFGAVGSEVARWLRSSGENALRLGGRNPQPHAWAQSDYVDVQDPESVMKFCAGCQLIINCAAPSCRLSADIARYLIQEGIPLVDAGGVDCPAQLASLMASSVPTPTCVFAAGALPGLSALLPLWLSRIFDQVNTLHCWFSIFDSFTENGAEDYLDGILNADRDTDADRGQSRRQYDVSLPFLPRPVTLQPYQDAESRWVEKQLNLSHSHWFLALDGEHLSRALERVRTLSRPRAIQDIVRGSRLDVAGRQPGVTFLIQMEGRQRGEQITRTLLLRAPGIAALTAACTAACATLVLNTLVLKNSAPIMGLAAQCLDPDEMMSLLSQGQTGINVELFDVAVSTLSHTTGGAI